MLRPDVVWFGEALDSSVLQASFEAARRAKVCIVVGTSAVVYPAASVPEITIKTVRTSLFGCFACLYSGSPADRPFGGIDRKVDESRTRLG
jgi:NAD-dependent SIR2 family protein deacetylase